MQGGKFLARTLNRERPADLGLRQEITVVLPSMAVRTGLITIGVYIRLMATLIHPRLADGMQSVWPARRADRYCGVTRRALGDSCRVALQRLGIHVVVGLQAGKFRVL